MFFFAHQLKQCLFYFIFCKEKNLLDTNAQSSISTTGFSQLAYINDFLQLKGQGLSEKFFCYTSFFFKRYFAIIKLEIELPYTCDIRPFLSIAFPLIPLKWLFISFSNIFAITKWSISTFFPIFLFPFYFFTRFIFFLF